MRFPEWMLDEIEEANQEAFAEQLRRSQADFREGRTVPWEEVKRRNNLNVETER